MLKKHEKYDKRQSIFKIFLISEILLFDLLEFYSLRPTLLKTYIYLGLVFGENI